MSVDKEAKLFLFGLLISVSCGNAILSLSSIWASLGEVKYLESNQ